MVTGAGAEPVAPAFHAAAADDVFDALGSSRAGLDDRDAAHRLEVHGPNTVAYRRRESLVEELFESVTEPLQLLLIAVGVLSALWGEVRDGIAIFVVIDAVATTEAFSERRAHRALAALHALAAPTARVRRDGTTRDMPTAEVVPGDVVVLTAGDVVAADARVVEAVGLAADESALTGEPVPAAKGPSAVAPDTPLGARTSMVYAGTAVVAGTGSAVVVATGATSELGRLARMVVEEDEPETPLQRSMRELAGAILLAAIAASVIVPAIGVARGQPVKDMVLAGLTLAFATIPEELPILITLLVAVGGRRLARQGALLRRLRSGEALGATTVVVTDKTGTLTHNQLRLDRVVGDRAAVLRVAAAARPPDDTALTDPIEVALAQAAGHDGDRTGEVVAHHPFDPDRKRMSVVRRDPVATASASRARPKRSLRRARPPAASRRPCNSSPS